MGIISGTPTESGVYDFTIQAKAGDYAVSNDFTLEVRNFFISSVSQLPEIATGKLYSFKFTAQGLSDDLIIWSADNDALPDGLKFYNAGLIVGSTDVEGTLPGGLTLAAENGVISGTPTTAGIYPFSVQVTAGKTTSKDFTLSVLGITSSPDIVLPDAKQGEPYSF